MSEGEREDQTDFENREKKRPTLPQEKWSDKESEKLEEPPEGEDIPTIDDLDEAEKIGENRYVIRTGGSDSA